MMIGSLSRDDFVFYDTYRFSEHAGRNDNEKFAIAGGPMWIMIDDRSVSDYPESRISLQSTTQFLHNEESQVL